MPEIHRPEELSRLHGLVLTVQLAEPGALGQEEVYTVHTHDTECSECGGTGEDEDGLPCEICSGSIDLLGDELDVLAAWWLGIPVDKVKELRRREKLSGR